MHSYLFATDPEQAEVVLIIRTSSPSIVGRAVMFSNKLDMEDFIARKKAADGFTGAQVEGYTILIVPAGELPINTPRSKAPDGTWEQMADFFYTNRIAKNERPYRRNRIVG